ncbi:hypothetical protein ABTL77_19885, partial [Acinetobacter baumannii]
DLSGRNKPVNREIAQALKPLAEDQSPHVASRVDAMGLVSDAMVQPQTNEEVSIRTVPLNPADGAPKPAAPIKPAMAAAPAAPEKPAKMPQP